MTWGKSLLLALPLILSGIFAVGSPATALDRVSGEWTSVSLGSDHRCAINGGRSLYCWGDNDSGQVGNGGDGHQDAPDDIGADGVWTRVSAGAAHTCAITTGRSLYCWGNNDDGQIGDGTTTDRPTPRRIGSSGVWATVSAGATHTCAITTGRSLYCWGNNDDGQIGDGTTTDRPSPRRIGAAGVWTTVTAGATHTCGISTGKSLYCWGNNDSGQIGDGTRTDRPSPRRIGAAGVWTTATAGGTHTCGVSTGKSLYCWGSNDSGQIGDGSATDRPTPRKIGSTGVWTAATAGATHTCAISTGRSLYCWGENGSRQIGDGTTTDRPSPRRIWAAGVWTTVTAGVTHTCAISTGRSLYCWGENTDGVNYPTPGTFNPASVPGFGNMTYWKLTAPVDDSGGTDGDAVEIKHPDLATFKNPDYFHASSDNQKVYFRARVDGATTSGSSYPRSELREMKSNGSTNAAWSNATETHQMTITQAITQLPEARPNVVAGQIHGGSGESDVLQIRLEGSKLFARFEGDSDLDQTLNSNYQLGTMFTVGIRADASGIAVAYADVKGVSKQVNHNVVAIAPTWYFKAGCYTQSNDSVSNEPDDAYGEVLIDSLTITPVT